MVFAAWWLGVVPNIQQERQLGKATTHLWGHFRKFIRCWGPEAGNIVLRHIQHGAAYTTSGIGTVKGGQWLLIQWTIRFGTKDTHGLELFGAGVVAGVHPWKGGPKRAQVEWFWRGPRLSVQLYGLVSIWPVRPTSPVSSGPILSFAGHVHVPAETIMIVQLDDQN